MRTPSHILASSRPAQARFTILVERHAAKPMAELERYAMFADGWVREMWLAAIALKRGEGAVPYQPTCSVYGDKHRVVYITERGTADIFRCACSEERWNAREAFSPECDYLIIDADEEAERLEALPARRMH